VGERPPATAAKIVQGYVARLRKLLPPGLVETREPGYRINLREDRLDLARFEQLRQQAASAAAEGGNQAARELLASALVLWRGPPLADVADELRLPGELARLEELRLVTLEERIDAELALGYAAALVPELEALVAEQPLRERLRGQLMLALYRVGRQADALALFRQTREFLVEEVGIERGAELQQLEHRILIQDESLAGPTVEVELPLLPVALTPLVGRLQELAHELMQQPGVRLITLLGPGGVGKTRLALAAAELRPSVFVPLAPLQVPSLIRSAIARAIGLDDEALLVSWLRRTELLLVLDNFEHLLDGAAVVTELLTATRALQVLTTSRAPLNLTGEHQFAVPPLPAPDAADLFIERAAAVQVRVEDDGLVEQVCDRLDCLPLAIELAAARSKAIPPPLLLARLEQRLGLLTGGPSDVPDRQRTLRATIDWSYDLLALDERRLFARLSVFAGGCTLGAAEEVCEATLDAIESLVDKSLLQPQGDRFAMLETIREYAQERLDESGEGDAMAAQHAEWVFALIVELAPKLEGAIFSADAARMLAEVDEIRVAMRFALDSGQGEAALRIATALYRFWAYFGSQAESLRWLELALERSLSATRAERAAALRVAAFAALMVDDVERGAVLASEAVEEYHSIGDVKETADALVVLGGAWGLAGDGDRARACFTEAVEVFERLDDPSGLARALANLGELERGLGDSARAAGLFRRALEIQRRLGKPGSHSMHGLAMLAIERGDVSEARELLFAAYSPLVGSGVTGSANVSHAVGCLSGFAELAAHERRAVLAGRLWGAVEAIEEQGMTRRSASIAREP
jgi:predicted ATPase